MPEARILAYQRWLEQRHGLRFADYDALWQWSVDDPQAFWASQWDWHGLSSPTPFERVLSEAAPDAGLPGARWFEGAQVNYVRQVLRHADTAYGAGVPAIVFRNEWMHEDGCSLELSWYELRRQVASLAVSLRRLGVQRGDRVAAYLPNTPQTVVAFLACASIGAIWSLCAPELGLQAVADRFRQIEPRVLIACDGSSWGGIDQDRRPVIAELLEALPSVEHFVLWPYLLREADPEDFDAPGRRTHDLRALLAGDPRGFEPEWLPFDHPLWIVYTSGTTGLPKPVVHSHGGVMLEALKTLSLHLDLGPAVATGERFHWATSTAWIMWNVQVNALLLGTTLCLYDGSPTGRGEVPDWLTVWRFVADTGTTVFGAGTALYTRCRQASAPLRSVTGLARLREVCATGAALPPECYDWLWGELPGPDGHGVWVHQIASNADIGSTFLAGLPTLPVRRGELQCRCLGAAVEAWGPPDAQGRGLPLTGQTGDLVCTRPMPSMPARLWHDPLGTRLHECYFDTYPGGSADGRVRGPVWRHGDHLCLLPRPEAGATAGVIEGRSDASIVRQGQRLGTEEIYRALEALPELTDSLAVCMAAPGQSPALLLLLALRPGLHLDDELRDRVRERLVTALSPAHEPDVIEQVAAVPRTLSGKKMELPVRRLLQGVPPQEVLNRDAMANPGCLDEYLQLARRLSTGPQAA